MTTWVCLKEERAGTIKEHGGNPEETRPCFGVIVFPEWSQEEIEGSSNKVHSRMLRIEE